jgi:hypothetical protein
MFFVSMYPPVYMYICLPVGVSAFKPPMTVTELASGPKNGRVNDSLIEGLVV